MVLTAMARASAAQGDYEGALARYQEARAIRLELGEKLIANESLLAIAELALAHNHIDEAARSAREAARIFRELGLPRNEAKATAVLARCQQTAFSSLRF
jgi:tetratricopeptide (TPR) repeat protein